MPRRCRMQADFAAEQAVRRWGLECSDSFPVRRYIGNVQELKRASKTLAELALPRATNLPAVRRVIPRPENFQQQAVRGLKRGRLIGDCRDSVDRVEAEHDALCFDNLVKLECIGKVAGLQVWLEAGAPR